MPENSVSLPHASKPAPSGGVLSTLIAKELRLNILSYRFYIVLILLVGLGLAATAIRTDVYQRMLSDHNDGRIMREQQQQNIKTIMDAFALGYVAQRQPDRLSIFCYGLEDDLTRMMQATLNDGDHLFPRTNQNVLFRINYRFDFVTIMMVLGSLLALILVFDSIVRERESGTMTVLLSGPLARHSIILGKLTAGLLTLCIPFAIAWTASLVWVVFAGGVRFTHHELARLALIIAFSGGYLLVFFCAGLACSALCRKSATSLSVCLLLWGVFVLAGPSLLPPVAGMLVNGPSKVDLARIERQKNRQLIAEKSDSIRAFYSSFLKDTQGVNSETASELDQMITIQRRDFSRQYHIRLNEQANRLLSLLSLSPAAAYLYLCADISGTGPYSYNEHMARWNTYKNIWQNAQWGWAVRAPGAVLPVFESAAPGIRRTLQAGVFGIMSLALWAVLFCLVAVMGFLRDRSSVRR